MGRETPGSMPTSAIRSGKIAGIGKIDPESGQRAISAKGLCCYAPATSTCTLTAISR